MKRCVVVSKLYKWSVQVCECIRLCCKEESNKVKHKTAAGEDARIRRKQKFVST